MSFNPIDYKPPFLSNDSWNDTAMRVVGKLVKNYGPLFETGDDLFDHYGIQVAELWEEKDTSGEDTDWYDLIRSMCIRIHRNEMRNNPEFFQPVPEDGDIIIVDRYQKAGTECRRMFLADALQESFDSDAHFIPAVGVDHRPLKDEVFSLSYVVFDLDTPEHAPLEDCTDWLEDVIQKIEDHSLLSEYRAFYTTSGGARLIYQPERILKKDEFDKMKQVLQHQLETAGVEVDKACKDYGRLYRLPLVIRSGEKQAPLLNEVQDTTLPVLSPPKVLNNFYFDDDDNRVPLSLPNLAAKLLYQTGGWPKSVGGQLFYLDKYNQPTNIITPNEFEGFVRGRIDAVNFFNGGGYVSVAVLFESLRQYVENYDSIDTYPFEPPQKRSYVLNDLPEHGKGKLNEFMNFFHPDRPEDALLLKSMIMTPMANTLGKPVFIVDSSCGRGAGKTSLCRKIGQLYGGTISVGPRDVQSGIQKEAAVKFLNERGRKSRVVLIDNVVGFFKSKRFAEVITSDRVEGRLPYGRNVVTRKNDLSWFMTSNDGTYDTDMISRSLFLNLKNHKPSPDWDYKVDAWIENNREELLAEIRNLISGESKVTLNGGITRFRDWEEKVLKKACLDDEEYSLVCKYTTNKKEESNGDDEILDELLTLLHDSLPEADGSYLIPKRLFYNRVVTEGMDNGMGYNTFASIISEGIKTGKLGRLNKRSKYGGRTGKSGRRCWIWGLDEGNPPELKTAFNGKNWTI